MFGCGLKHTCDAVYMSILGLQLVNVHVYGMALLQPYASLVSSLVMYTLLYRMCYDLMLSTSILKNITGYIQSSVYCYISSQHTSCSDLDVARH